MLRVFGFHDQRIIDQGYSTTGTVIQAKHCRWLKANYVPLRSGRMNSTPHIFSFSYTVEGVEYFGRQFIGQFARCPWPGETLTVYYDKTHPKKCAVVLK